MTLYQVYLKGQLIPQWSAWFDDWVITHTVQGDTRLTGIITDQAALYGLLARCRDVGVTLIALYPLGWQQEHIMNTVQVTESLIINAPSAAIYAVLTDYRGAHNAILPRPYFTEMVVEQGGVGAGTVLRLAMNVFGQQYHYHQIVTEPEPGRVLVETDMDTGQYSRFLLEPLHGGAATKVTIESVFPAEAGFKGVMQKIMQPPITRHIFRKELHNLAEYVRVHQPADSGQPSNLQAGSS